MAYAHNQPEYSVSEISGHVKRVVEDTFGMVRVRGEISKVSVNAASGHAYLSMKDDKALLDAVCWKGTYARLQHKPEQGLEMIATGRLTTYPGSSKYQLVIDSLEPAGIGALMAQLEKRKQQLAAEGLFDESRKKELPYLPKVIGVITSPTGAVIRDILHRISDRFPSHVIVWPVAVQGKGAENQIAEAIEGFQNFSPKPDVLIVARGGGSIEDLWCFNEEIVVRAAANSNIPLISAVGHETDTTLIDYAADVRAPTPTAAAEMAVPVREEIMLLVEEQGLRMREALLRRVQFAQERLDGVLRGLPRPERLMELVAQRLDDLSTRLQLTLPSVIERAAHRIELLTSQLTPLITRKLEKAEQRVALATSQLKHLDVQQILRRGFAIVKQGNTVFASASAVPKGEVTLQFADGERKARVD
jgi:exodeoxyribonuclease VII large subunit